jgi:hypothetical protein
VGRKTGGNKVLQVGECIDRVADWRKKMGRVARKRVPGLSLTSHSLTIAVRSRFSRLSAALWPRN